MNAKYNRETIISILEKRSDSASHSIQAKSLITWEKLPDDFVLPDDPVENIQQPFLAAALTKYSMYLVNFQEY